MIHLMQPILLRLTVFWLTIFFWLTTVTTGRLQDVAQLTIRQPNVAKEALKKNLFLIPYMDVSASDPLQLECTGNQPLQWIYPSLQMLEDNNNNTTSTMIDSDDDPDSEGGDESSRSTPTPKPKITSDCKEGQRCQSKFVLQQGANELTGEYRCVYSLQHPPNASDQDTVYIFFNDEQSLLVPYEGNPDLIFLSMIQSQPATVPCKSSNSKANVTLSKVHTLSGQPEPLRVDGKLVQFDPTIGFHFTRPRWDSESSYLHCTAKFGDRSDEVYVTVYWSIEPTYGIHPQIDDSQARNVLLNGSFTLDCIVHLELGVLISVQWQWPSMQNGSTDGTNVTLVANNLSESDSSSSAILPSSSGVGEASVRIWESASESRRAEIGGSEYEIVSRKLHVRNVTAADQGLYRCNVTDARGQVYSQSKYVQVLNARLPAYINFTLDLDPLKPLRVKTGDRLQLVVTVHALPDLDAVRLDWLRNGQWLANARNEDVLLPTMSSSMSGDTSSTHASTMDSTDRLQFKIENGQALLIIRSLVVSDSAVYTLVGNNSDLLANVSITLEVEGVPSIEIRSELLNGEAFFTAGRKQHLTCEVVSFPAPRIRWLRQWCAQDSCALTEDKWAVLEPIAKNASHGNVDDDGDDDNDEHVGSLQERLSTLSELNRTQNQDPTTMDQMIRKVARKDKQRDWTFPKPTLYRLALNLTSRHSAVYRCVASNDNGSAFLDLPLLVSDVGPMGFSLVGRPEQPVQQDEVLLHCGGVHFNYTGLAWQWRPLDSPDKTPIRLQSNTSNVRIENFETVHSIQSNLWLLNVEEVTSGEYECVARRRVDSREENADQPSPEFSRRWPLLVQQMISAQIRRSNLPGEEVLDALQTTQIDFYCEVFGRPRPTIQWLRNGKPLNVTGMSGVEISQDGQHLVFKRLVVEDSGRYECIVSNRGGEQRRFARLRVHRSLSRGLSAAAIAGIVTFVLIGVVFVAMALFLGRRIREERIRKREFAMLGESLFQQGQMDLFNTHLPLDEQIELLPYDPRWEFPKERLRLGPTLGQGAFGRVVKAEATGLLAHGGACTVAVKMLKETADIEQRKALMAELKILVHLGRHLNIVNLLGAVTKHLAHGELMVIVEYCKFGNLRHYLIANRSRYVHQVREDGSIDASICNPIRSSQPQYANQQVLDRMVGLQTSLLTNASDTPDGIAPEAFVSTCDLLCYSFQVCRGMDYLAKKKLIHRDLAARNVLLAEGNVVKICDFGLAKDCYKYDNYVRKGNGPLPVKWMAIESIADKLFTSKSDVWSFGILLWEMFTLGQNPYPGLEVDEQFYHRLRSGYRMERPDLCPQGVYEIMQSCWSALPEERPDFTRLAEMFAQQLDDSVSAHYIELNEPYQQLNELMYQENEGYLQVDQLMEERVPYGQTGEEEEEGEDDDEQEYLNIESETVAGGTQATAKPFLLQLRTQTTNSTTAKEMVPMVELVNYTNIA